MCVCVVSCVVCVSSVFLYIIVGNAASVVRYMAVKQERTTRNLTVRGIIFGTSISETTQQSSCVQY